jgi:hypothetical protein
MTSTKLQTNPNEQSSRLETKSLWSFGIGDRDLFEIWNLGFGILPGSRKRSPR